MCRLRIENNLKLFYADPEAACLDNYPIHTITGLVKRWLRELPDPLMTFALYGDFLHAVGEWITVVFSFLNLNQEGLIGAFAFVCFVFA